MIDFLSELARYLVAAGLPYTRIEGMVRQAYFHAASSQSKFGNERLNQSAVAAMTGLTRVQVRHLAKRSTSVHREKRDRIDNVIDGWSTDAAFTLPSNEPKRLRIRGRGPSFEQLVRKYGGDIPAKSLLRELQRLGYARVREGRVSLRSTMKQNRDEVRLRRVTQTLTDLLRAPAGRPVLQTPLRALCLEVTYPATMDKGRALLQKRSEDGLRAYLASVREAGSAAAMDSPLRIKKDRRYTRTRVVVLTEDVTVS